MKIVFKNEIEHFLGNTYPPKVSLYIDTYRAGPETQQNPIKLKNLLKEAEKQLGEFDPDGDAKNKLLQPARKLIDNHEFWQHQREGLALFLSPDDFRYYHLPYPVPEFALVSDHFHLKPMMPLYAKDDQFHLLALDQKHVNLYEGNRYSIRKKPLPELPKSLAEALKYDDHEALLNFHVAGPGGGAGQNAIYHGQGSEKDIRRDQLLRFFREIDKALHDYLKDSRKPLVLSGVDYYFPIYREANTYPVLMDEGVKRVDEKMSEKELHAKAWKITEPFFREVQNKAAERYKTLSMQNNGANHHKTADQFEDVIPAAYNGQVDTLFALRDHQQWGIFDEESLSVELDARQNQKRKELLDFAALHTLQHDGQVFLVARENMPEESPIAAILRY